MTAAEFEKMEADLAAQALYYQNMWIQENPGSTVADYMKYLDDEDAMAEAQYIDSLFYGHA